MICFADENELGRYVDREVLRRHIDHEKATERADHVLKAIEGKGVCKFGWVDGCTRRCTRDIGHDGDHCEDAGFAKIVWRAR